MLPGMDRFDANTKALFEGVLLAWSMDKPLTVRHTIGIERLGSPATLHKRLTTLRKLELIKSVGHDSDRRTKFLVPTNQGLDYAAKLGQACSQSLQADL